MFTLMVLMVQGDLTNHYVVTHSSADLHIFYLITGAWAGSSGSLLFWYFILTSLSAVAVYQSRILRNRMPFLFLVLAGLQFIFVFMGLYFSDAQPFRVFPQPMKAGQGLNPLLHQAHGLLVEADGHHGALLVWRPDRPAGRGMALQASPVKLRALEAGLPVLQPETLKTPEVQAALAELRPDLLIVVAYGLILPGWTLTAPRLGCLNIHASRLPRWRGAAPIHRAIEAGDDETGVTIMQMDAGLDTGDILLLETLPIRSMPRPF
jgi:hypothetical protein